MKLRSQGASELNGRSNTNTEREFPGSPASADFVVAGVIARIIRMTRITPTKPTTGFRLLMEWFEHMEHYRVWGGRSNFHF